MANRGAGEILAGDIGGTKSYLGLFADAGERLELIKKGSFVNTEFSGPEEIIEEFIGRRKAHEIAAAAFGIACPVEGNRCRMTNLDWIVDGEAIKKKFGIKKLELLNDLVAIGWGVDLLSKGDLLVLQKGEKRPGNAALIAAGTGLGEALLFWDGASHVPAGSEGGHADFAPRTPLQMELLAFLQKKYGHVSWERVLSGPGLENIYGFLISRKGQVPERLEKRFEDEGVSPVVSQEAMEGRDETCREALELFVSIYGAEAGNLALKGLSIGGVYVGGGIAPKILKFMQAPAFLDAFRGKGRFEELLSRIPVSLIMNDRAGLIGAASCAARAADATRKIRSVDYSIAA